MTPVEYTRKDYLALARLSLTRAVDLLDDGDPKCIKQASRVAWEAFGYIINAMNRPEEEKKP